MRTTAPAGRRAIAGLSALAAALWILLSDGTNQNLPLGDDAAEMERMLLTEEQTAASVDDTPNPDGNRMCIATIDDGTILASSIADAEGRFEWALPEKYDATAKVECTVTDPRTGDVAVVDAREESASGGEGTGVIEEGLDKMSFRPGYYDRATNTWHDPRTSYASPTVAEARNRREARLAPENCPLVSRTEGRDLWVHLVGDSVTRGLIQMGLYHAGVKMRVPFAQEWRTGRNSDLADVILRGVDVDGRKVWISYAFDFLHDRAELMHPIPRTWGEFLERRSTAGTEAQNVKLGSSTNDEGDPDFDEHRSPDVVFWSPGYHASKATAAMYGKGVEDVLTAWKAKMDEIGAPMPRIHLALNVMPAYWMIPRRFSDDVSHRTLLNEHRKNLAMIEMAKKFDFVEGVVDLNSVELPFNGKPGGTTAHGDAVHVRDKNVLVIMGDLVLDSFCRSRGVALKGEGDSLAGTPMLASPQ